MKKMSIEDLAVAGLRIVQSEEGFRFGQDSLLLAHVALHWLPPRLRGRPWADLAAGSGVVGLLFASLQKALYSQTSSGYAIERDQGMLELLARNRQLNAALPLSVLSGDLLQPRKTWVFQEKNEGGEPVLPPQIDVLLMNPPYQAQASGARARRHPEAYQEDADGLATYLQTASSWLKPQGRFYLCLRPQRLQALATGAFRAGLGLSRLCLVSARPGARPRLLLVELQKNPNCSLRWEPDLYLACPELQPDWWGKRPGRGGEEQG